jgi:hypothetical protein
MIKWWKGIFNDLKPYSIMSMDEVLDRYLSGLKSFPNHYKAQYENGAFFININKQHLYIDELKYYHEKYNSPFCSFEGSKLRGPDDYEPSLKLTYSLKENRNFTKPEYEIIKFEGHTSNYNNRDGQIRGGFATPNFYNYFYKARQDKKISGEWMYCEIPHNIIYDNLKQTANGVEIEIAKNFVNEVESTIGWEDIAEIKKLVDIYDKKYPNWNHDFPINGYMQMKKDGLLFPAVWTFPTKLVYHSFHRLIMTSFNKMNFPFIIPVPYGKTKWNGQSVGNHFFNEGKNKYLNFYFDLNSKITKFDFSEDKKNFYE